VAGSVDLLVLQQGSMTAQWYRNEVLDIYTRPYVGDIGDDVILIDDNAPPYRARIVLQYKKSVWSKLRVHLTVIL
jgi:hypothetical protein